MKYLKLWVAVSAGILLVGGTIAGFTWFLFHKQFILALLTLALGGGGIPAGSAWADDKGYLD